jgi:hypothetical protein
MHLQTYRFDPPARLKINGKLASTVIYYSTRPHHSWMVSSRDTAVIAYPLSNRGVTQFSAVIMYLKAIIFLSQKLSYKPQHDSIQG